MRPGLNSLSTLRKDPGAEKIQGGEGRRYSEWTYSERL